LDRLKIRIGSHLGANLDYVADGHKGLDHVAFQLEITRPVWENLTASGSLSYDAPIQKNERKHADDADLYDGFQFGIAVALEF